MRCTYSRDRHAQTEKGKRGERERERERERESARESMSEQETTRARAVRHISRRDTHTHSEKKT